MPDCIRHSVSLVLEWIKMLMQEPVRYLNKGSISNTEMLWYRTEMLECRWRWNRSRCRCPTVLQSDGKLWLETMSWIRIRMQILIQIISLMRIRMWVRILIFIWCGSGYLFDADADTDLDQTFHPDSVPDPDPSFKIKAQILEKCSNRLVLHTWLVICKLMWIQLRFRIQLFILVQILFWLLFDADADPYYKMMRIDPDPDPLHWLEILFINA